MGVSLAGFESLAVVELDRWACDTIRENQKRGYPVVFPATVDVVRTLQPKSFIIENVKGLTRSSFANYYQYILLQLEFPDVTRRNHESWLYHLRRLQVEKTSGVLRASGLAYNVVPTLVNAADYGVPQKRERVFMVGFRSDLGIEWSFPRPTHGLDALLYSQWVTGEYWERHGVAKHRRPKVPTTLDAKVRQLASSFHFFHGKPWRTIRDALVGLPDPRQREARACVGGSMSISRGNGGTDHHRSQRLPSQSPTAR